MFLGRYRQRPQHLFGGIGTMMVVVGLLIDLYLTIDKFFGHPIGQRPLLLLGALLIIVGIQLGRRRRPVPHKETGTANCQ